MVYVFLLLVSFLTHWVWLTNLSVMNYGDWIYQDQPTLKEFFAFPSIWSPVAFGDVNIGISFTPFMFIYGLFSQWNFSYGLSERLIFLWPILIALPICSYLLIKKNFNNTLAAVVGFFVYGYNTFFAMAKAYTFAFLISSIPAYYGYNVKGGALEIGRASTRSVVVTCVAVLFFDYILAAILLK